MKLTEEEKNIILAKRKEEEDKLPKMEGYAKEDLYRTNEYKLYPPYSCASSSERKEMIEKFSQNNFDLAAPTGTKFECYIDNAEEQWYDTYHGYFEGMSGRWARKYLKDIKPVKRKK